MKNNKGSYKFLRNLKSQAALEFLTTYAWAFLTIMIAVGALYYFGVFDFAKFLPQKCTFTSQFECLAFSFVLNDPTNEIRFKLINNIGEEVNINSFEVTNNEVTPLSCDPPAIDPLWQHGEEKHLIFTNCASGSFIARERMEAKITMKYCAPATTGCPEHTINGKIIAVVNPE